MNQIKDIDFVEHLRSKYLKIFDFEILKIGETIKVVNFDRNWLDVARSINKSNTFYSPNDYLRGNIINITKINNLLFHFNFCDSQGNTSFERKLPLHIYFDTFWYPLDKNSHVPSEDYQGFCDLSKYAGKNWTELGKDMLAGYRGPMVLYSDLDKDILIYH